MVHTLQNLFDIPAYQKEHSPQRKTFNTKKNGKWEAISTDQFLADIDRASKSLLALKVLPGEKISVITTGNRYEWHVLDHAMMQIGVVNVPLYDTLSSNDFSKILYHSDAKLCFVSDQVLHDKISSIQSKTKLEDIYFFTSEGNDYSWQHFMELGKGQQLDGELSRLKNNVKTDDLATIMYTSGTTGDPKGVMLSHKNFLTCVFWAADNLPLKGPNIKIVSYLPISHMFERFTTYYYMYMGFEIYFAESIEKLVENMQEVKPDFIPIVPRLVEKIYDKIVAKGLELKGIKKKIFFWALDLTEEFDFYNEGNTFYKLKMKIANKLIFSKWRDVFGGNIKFMVSGSAPLQARLVKTFGAAGLSIFEGYGMTELAPVISFNELKNKGLKAGSVGRPIPVVDLKIAEDGEIMVKGDNLFLGYYKNPEATAKDFTDGYFHTGDVGNIDENGLLTITDRKKQIFKTSSGKYISPGPIENTLRQSNFIEQIMVIGENRKMPVALLDINLEFVKNWEVENNYTCVERHCDPKLLARIQQEIDFYNKEFGHWEAIKKFAITPEPWSIEAGHMTPTLKIKRKFLLEKHSDLIDGLYA